MKLAKWGNSLGIRLPAEVVNKMNLKPGDEVEVAVKGEHRLEIVRDRSREEALKKLRKLRIEVPADYKFDRNEIYDR